MAIPLLLYLLGSGVTGLLGTAGRAAATAAQVAAPVAGQLADDPAAPATVEEGAAAAGHRWRVPRVRAATTDAAGTPRCDASSMAFMGTRVVAGDGVAVTTATGPHTVWGRIAVLTRALPAGRRAR